MRLKYLYFSSYMQLKPLTLKFSHIHMRKISENFPHVSTIVCNIWYLKVDGLDPVSVDEECEEVDAQESNHETQHQAPHQEPHLLHISQL
jgi:hypothetical protein